MCVFSQLMILACDVVCSLHPYNIKFNLKNKYCVHVLINNELTLRNIGYQWYICPCLCNGSIFSQLLVSVGAFIGHRGCAITYIHNTKSF